MNNQQITKIINFYRVNYNFHQPYRLIIDGNFLKVLVEKELVQKLPKWLENIAHGKVKLYTTSCIQKQLEIFGSLFQLVFEAAKKMKKCSCGHKSIDEGGASNCIFDILSNTQQKYILCTQDIQLRRKIRNTKNIPLMYFGPDQRITMQDIEKKTVKNLQQQIKDRMLPKANELQPIKQFKKEQWKRQKQAQKQKIVKNASMLGLKPKTKIAKGPNPLSMKKKKKQHINRDSSNHQNNNDQNQSQKVFIPKTKKISKKINQQQ